MKFGHVAILVLLSFDEVRGLASHCSGLVLCWPVWVSLR